ncbi:MAG: hypothetical protein CMH61_00660 [Nanoarchaeota archaeon]|nr:hypothetical protein [Nanoarchaeota archaeon]|tara:strand:- start:2349 stop:2951 length:603 start_codon:yes stop_codon:yes gene_type:complete
MKLLALSDVHGDVHWMKSMAEKAEEEKVDLVLLCGDLSNEDEIESVEGLIGPFKKKNLDVAIIPGNHEGMATTNFLIEKYGLKNLHGYSLKFGDIGIFGCGYANIGMHQLSEKQFLETLRKSHDQLKNVKKKVMVTHLHPEESIIGLNMFPGSTGIRQAIEELKPDLHLCGHIHETEGVEEIIGNTKVINVGKRGKIIEI